MASFRGPHAQPGSFATSA